MTRMETGWEDGRTVKCSVFNTAGSTPPISDSDGNAARSSADVEEVVGVLEELDDEDCCGGRMKKPPSLGSKCSSTADPTPVWKINELN
jgi:hypothetical protein